MIVFNSGGAATCGGVDFQQRVAGYFMVYMLFELKSLLPIGLDGDYDLLEISFETANSIDDIEVSTDSCKFFIQAKRSISLSSSENSEFVKVIRQFVNQYITSGTKEEKYLLVTSSDASSKIKKELRKITESARLNDTGFENNPLNKSEENTFEKLKQSVSSAYNKIIENTLSEQDFIDIIKRIYVIIFDIQKGMPLENALLTLLSSKTSVSPEIIWAIIIKHALSLASNRQSLNKTGIKDSLGKYLAKHTDEEKKAIASEIIKIEYSDNIVRSGREVLLIKSFDEDFDFMLVELKRFDELGNKNFKFSDDKCELPDGRIWQVIHRAATLAGVQRYIEENADNYSDKKLAILSKNAKEDYDLSESALAHGELCKKMILNSAEPLNCIKCGDFVSEDATPLVEIDCETSDHKVGLVHKECLESIDRILGKIDAELFREYDFLKDFDYITWFNQLQGGQGLFNGLHSKPAQIYPMAWKSDALKLSKGKYCIKINLEDGSSRYVHDRGKVLKQPLEEAEKKLDLFVEGFKKSKSDKDPWCYTSKKEQFGNYSKLEKLKDEDEECIECVNAEIVVCTKAVEDAYSNVKNFYAPVFILTEKDSGLPLLINNALFILNNPLELGIYLKNWNKAGIEIPEYSIKIIKTDEEFDLYMAQLLQDGVQVVANPKFNMKAEPISGIVFQEISVLESIYKAKKG
jgi:hypothetical protein